MLGCASLSAIGVTAVFASVLRFSVDQYAAMNFQATVTSSRQQITFNGLSLIFAALFCGFAGIGRVSSSVLVRTSRPSFKALRPAPFDTKLESRPQTHFRPPGSRKLASASILGSIISVRSTFTAICES